jgi:hypothetical protein
MIEHDIPGDRWSLEKLPRVSVSPAVSTPIAPKHLRAVLVAERVPGTVVAKFGSMLTVLSDRGERFHGVVPRLDELRMGDACVFNVSQDSETGSRLRVAVNIRPVRE